MKKPATVLEIRTLGCFSISVEGKPVASVWPNETLKVLFCSLLSPLDLSFTWDRISRSMWGVPVLQLKEIFIGPLNSFLIEELGFNPLIAGHEGIRIDLQGIHVDAIDFYGSAVEGLRLFSINNHAAALIKVNRAHSLYTGSYLPGIPGKINTDTRNDLKSLYLTAVKNAMPLLCKTVGISRAGVRSIYHGRLKSSSNDEVRL